MTYRLPSLLTASALAAAAFLPPAADAKLGGHPMLSVVDSHHATLEFAADKLPRNADGTYDATITFAGGKTVGRLKAVGTHGDDIRYAAKITSKRAFRVNTKYTVRIKLADEPTAKRLVKLIDRGD
jgi:hypothetical protein